MKDTVDHLQGVVSTLQRRNHVVLFADDAIEFTEGRQSGRAHPHDEILIDETVVVRVTVHLVDGSAPVHRFGGSWNHRSNTDFRDLTKAQQSNKERPQTKVHGQMSHTD